MSDPPLPEMKGYVLAFLTEQWQWERSVSADTLEEAKAAGKAALAALVAEERPDLACVTILKDGEKVGVWDWIETRPYWTPL